jgi:AAA+ ATPase superfamily predicted ATPase
MLEMQSSQLTGYIEKLIDLAFIDKEIPVTEKNPLKSKLGRYCFGDNFLPFAYEDYVKETIMQDPVAYLGFVPLKIGRWWNNKEEIDLVAFDEEQIAFIECKWRNQPAGIDLLTSLKKKSELLQSSLKPHYIVFSKSGCTDTLENSEALCHVI